MSGLIHLFQVSSRPKVRFGLSTEKARAIIEKTIRPLSALNVCQAITLTSLNAVSRTPSIPSPVRIVHGISSFFVFMYSPFVCITRHFLVTRVNTLFIHLRLRKEKLHTNKAGTIFSAKWCEMVAFCCGILLMC